MSLLALVHQSTTRSMESCFIDPGAQTQNSPAAFGFQLLALATNAQPPPIATYFPRAATVTRSEFAVEDGRLDLYVDFPRGSRFACAECGREGCAVHDTKDETWRHPDFFQHGTLLHARVPSVSCPNCGVRKVATPWARASSGFTLLFEAYVLALAKAMPIANAAKRLGEHDTRLWRIVEDYVWRAVEALDLSQVRRIATDETSARRGRDYISLFVDMARRKVIYVADGKDAATVKEFADFLEAHGGKREAVTDASIDMGAAFEAGIKANFENAEITFDKFHVIKLANEAVDQVRREEAFGLRRRPVRFQADRHRNPSP